MNITAFKNPIVLRERIESSNPHAETLTFEMRVTHGTKRLYPENSGTQRWMKLLGNSNKTISSDQLKHLIVNDKFNINLNAPLD
tara:strand:- start:324 stop:575 length:252 start_codon:yes stop_codon:yes gene_type:complete